MPPRKQDGGSQVVDLLEPGESNERPLERVELKRPDFSRNVVTVRMAKPLPKAIEAIEEALERHSRGEATRADHDLFAEKGLNGEILIKETRRVQQVARFRRQAGTRGQLQQLRDRHQEIAAATQQERKRLQAELDEVTARVNARLSVIGGEERMAEDAVRTMESAQDALRNLAPSHVRDYHNSLVKETKEKFRDQVQKASNELSARKWIIERKDMPLDAMVRMQADFCSSGLHTVLGMPRLDLATFISKFPEMVGQAEAELSACESQVAEIEAQRKAEVAALQGELDVYLNAD